MLRISRGYRTSIKELQPCNSAHLEDTYDYIKKLEQQVREALMIDWVHIDLSNNSHDSWSSTRANCDTY